MNSLINDCINVENNIIEISKMNNINENLKKLSPNFFQVQLKWNQDNFNNYLKNIISYANNIVLFNSKIEFDENLIKSWLNNKNFIAELIFRKTENGSSPKDFHNKCDNQGITIIFIETSKGNKFGGYTELGWEGTGAKKDKNTFLFSFDNKEKYIAKNDFNSIYCEDTYGPIFGNFDEAKKRKFKKEKVQAENVKKLSDYNSKYFHFEIYFDDSLDAGKFFRGDENKHTFFFNNNILGGENWEVKELEVYKIIYI